ncbi:OLC1v1012480C1 [Oldenlandia corymbosa var. corymbosa]|uniref:Fucosyltransferase n=1 Tax=Oldenlandia corymbosa var. corymbosa TaxID=529605 RepID=A0AAV1DW81_OLDCO|nr:OLC1v1012480C1 [Oldenlandia corymbosa var. corymbosa]
MKDMVEMSSLEMEKQQIGSNISKGEVSKCVGNPTKAMAILLVCSMGSFLFSVLKDPSPDNVPWNSLYNFSLFNKDQAGQVPMDDNKRLLGGLLPQGMEKDSCLSRYQMALYRKRLQRKYPSSYLISRLRSYEATHKRCGPYTESYNRTLEYLKSGQYNSTSPTDCNYIVWISLSGLGNKMLTIASAFLYALLTNRVLLVDPGENIPDLFCEPFPEVSWLLPPDFPIIDKFDTFNLTSPDSYGNMLRHSVVSNSTVPPYVYLNLLHDLDDHDELFFCDQEQSLLHKVPWLILKSNNYFVPSLFLMQSFEEELNNLFPDEGSVFHFLGQYLFHPTNTVWGLITRFYEAYLARADEIIGIQVRIIGIVGKGPEPLKYVVDQIVGCARNENLLPEISEKKPIINPSKQHKTMKAVLITSLSAGYFETLRDMYWTHQTATGEIIEVYQPSHEENQHTENEMHNMKALAEINLLSLSDKLITSPWSTFGYVAQSLGGLRPWILVKSDNQTLTDPPCSRAASMDPCFHTPPNGNCREKNWVDKGKIVPHVQHCEDRSWGLKLVDRDNES